MSAKQTDGDSPTHNSGFFESMTSQQLDYWMQEIRPILVGWQEQSMARARRQALEQIRRPLRRRPAELSEGDPS